MAGGRCCTRIDSYPPAPRPNRAKRPFGPHPPGCRRRLLNQHGGGTARRCWDGGRPSTVVASTPIGPSPRRRVVRPRSAMAVVVFGPGRSPAGSRLRPRTGGTGGGASVHACAEGSLRGRRCTTPCPTVRYHRDTWPVDDGRPSPRSRLDDDAETRAACAIPQRRSDIRDNHVRTVAGPLPGVTAGQNVALTCGLRGGARENRTPDLFHAMAVLRAPTSRRVRSAATFRARCVVPPSLERRPARGAGPARAP
jgi:hypothetical protein